jgi:hypothetical protein
MGRPATQTARKRVGSPGWNQNVATPAATQARVTANRRSAGARQVRDPYHRPPAALPSA